MSVSVNRQHELARKYGIPEEMIQILRDKKNNKALFDETFGQFTTMLANALLNGEVEEADIKDVQTFVPNRYVMY